jgi:Methyltransferase domain
MSLADTHSSRGERGRRRFAAGCREVRSRAMGWACSRQRSLASKAVALLVLYFLISSTFHPRHDPPPPPPGREAIRAEGEKKLEDRGRAAEAVASELVPPANETVEVDFVKVFDELGGVQSSGCNLTEWGRGDGKKYACANAPALVAPDCWVLSLGSNGEWSYEESAVNTTACRIHTFDCTGDFAPPSHLADRVVSHKQCLRTSASAAKSDAYLLWPELVAYARRASQATGHAIAAAPAVLKLDVEGFEWEWLEYVSSLPSAETLPGQIAVELHLKTHLDAGEPWLRTGGDRLWAIPEPAERVALLFREKVYRAGYKLVSRDDNPFCKVKPGPALTPSDVSTGASKPSDSVCPSLLTPPHVTWSSPPVFSPLLLQHCTELVLLRDAGDAGRPGPPSTSAR